MPQVKGTTLCAQDQKAVLSAYVHRFTKEHVPAWSRTPRPDGKPYKVQFASDLDWLANTLFDVTRSGRLDQRSTYCESSPTWPDGCE